jgi:hypothetical protein
MDDCANGAADRGTYATLRFCLCARGYTLDVPNTDGYGRYPPVTFAFDKIEDVAAWLVAEYGPPPKAPTFKITRRKPARRR